MKTAVAVMKNNDMTSTYKRREKARECSVGSSMDVVGDLIPDIHLSSSSVLSSSSSQQQYSRKTPLVPTLRKKKKTFFDISLNTVVYNSHSILLSHIQQDKHLGSSCRTITDTLLVNRNKNSIGRWALIEKPPPYFVHVESDMNICNSICSSSSFERKAASMALVPELQLAITEFTQTRIKCNNIYRGRLNFDNEVSPGSNLWPVGEEGSNMKPSSMFPINTLRSKTPVGRRMSIAHTARDIFKVSDEAFARIITKRSSLLLEVHKICEGWLNDRKKIDVPSYVPKAYAPYTAIIGPSERFLEVKLGVYFMLEKGTVIKFLTEKACFSDFVIETEIGFSIDKKIKGAVGVIHTCPEAFCVEMSFAGVALQDVLNGDLNCILNVPVSTDGKREFIQHHMIPVKATGALYGVRMLQVTGRLPPGLRSVRPIIDSYSAVGVTGCMRKKLLEDIPFVIAEIINIVTRLSQQGLVNPDIKSDNIVIDGYSGQPMMIDFGLVIPVGKRDTSRSMLHEKTNMYVDYPQTAPEYLKGECCNEAAMTYGLAYLLTDMLNTLSTRTQDISPVSMSVNIPLVNFIAAAYDENPYKRPRAYLMAALIGACFPLPDHIASLFSDPKHTIFS
nr:wsv423-like protein [Chionoecetes opilio bacilliform virus]